LELRLTKHMEDSVELAENIGLTRSCFYKERVIPQGQRNDPDTGKHSRSEETI